MRSVFAALASVSVTALMLASAPASATEAGTWEVRLRAVTVQPDVGSNVNIGGKLSITDSVIPEADISYYFTKHWAVEVIAGTTKHSIYHNAAGKLATVYLLPPTVTVQYHFDKIGFFEPYVGAGPNMTIFYDRSNGPLGKLRTTDNWGFALQFGTDVPLTEDGRYVWNFDVKKLWLSTNASFSGAPVTAKVDINPWLIGTGVGIKF
ncbi:outer membrane protein [Rhizomicrobium palustre]|uniref:Outer membrane protein n=1 Tax=Rhizomicrobium palustre TaxID=189966 RepID=A0A846N1N1_9PROT|nr:OmpW family outer membrane protein [Rhizomicrobium palustre]NIK89399.1 outer membrane protein [Rhizomicrobium palustre]